MRKTARRLIYVSSLRTASLDFARQSEEIRFEIIFRVFRVSVANLFRSPPLGLVLFDSKKNQKLPAGIFL
ncbi:hypothetical protein ACJVDH_12835 [Pedobacter sp. AW1-32]|uniref:hypothetical protein n=1 Tax=Pedobacter sp. AW1-32 TaxID=3383026 RepID=UPI003FEE72C5